MPATKCNETGFWYFVGFITKRKYWGATAREAEQNAQLYFYR